MRTRKAYGRADMWMDGQALPNTCFQHAFFVFLVPHVCAWFLVCLASKVY
jgi:hypothetical protein